MAEVCATGSTWIILGSIVGGIIVLIIVIKILVFLIQKCLASRKLGRWKNTPKDVVILHCFPRGKTLPSLSPFVLKVETFLRLAKIPHKHDRKDSLGSKGKSPWITLNGEHVEDSDFIIRYLSKKFEKNVNSNCSEQQLAIANIVQTMTSEFLFCGMALQRFVYDDYKKFRENSDVPKLMFKIIGHVVRNRQEAQGIALHSQENVTEIMCRNMRSMSTVLGSQPYFGGEHMCEADCGIFGMLAQFMWSAQGSAYETLLNGDCKNLKEYCFRVKDKLWSDWEDTLQKPKNKNKV